MFDSTGQGIVVTDSAGTIKTVNPAFTELTGYSKEEVVGGSPNILKSGKQSKEFYSDMWKAIREQNNPMNAKSMS